jgi:hypothetical protein
VWPAGSGSQPSRADVLLAVFAVLLLLVIANYLRFAVATSGRLSDFILAYNFGRRLKAPKGLTPYEFICKCWTFRIGTIDPKSASANAGTKHPLAMRISASVWGPRVHFSYIAGRQETAVLCGTVARTAAAESRLERIVSLHPGAWGSAPKASGLRSCSAMKSEVEIPDFVAAA